MNKGILVINKESGLTSRDVVNKLVKVFNTKKIGHTGTLDPMASGVLVCLIGKYSKLSSIITSEEKEYIGSIKLGIKTDTLDITGNVIEENPNYTIDEDNIKKVFSSFTKEYEQIVPLYSAVHVNGKRLYEYARDNETISLPKRKVTIKSLELLSYKDSIITFKALVSKGTYIRSLVKDICDELNVLGTLNSLERCKQGIFTIDDSYTIEEVENNNYEFYPIDKVLDLSYIEVNDSNLYKKIINGNILNLDYNNYILFRKDGLDLAIYYFQDKIGKLLILF